MSQYFCNYLLYLLYLLPPGHRHKSTLTRKQHKLPNQHFPQRAKTKRKKDHNPKAWKKGDLKWSKLGKKKMMKRQKIQHK